MHANNTQRHASANKEPQGLLLKALKMAATYSPTTCSTIGVAELGVARSPPLPCLPPLPPLHSPLPALLPACCLLRWADTARGSPSPRSQTLLWLDFVDPFHRTITKHSLQSSHKTSPCTHAHANMYAHAYIIIYMHTHTHIHIHIHIARTPNNKV